MKYLTKNYIRRSSLLISFVVVVLFTLLPYILHEIIRVFPIYLSITLISISILSPYTLLSFFNIWFKLGIFLGQINSYLILLTFFYVIILPFALLKRLFLLLRPRGRSSSYYNRLESRQQRNFKDQY